MRCPLYWMTYITKQRGRPLSHRMLSWKVRHMHAACKLGLMERMHYMHGANSMPAHAACAHSLSKLTVSISEPCTFDSGTHACSSPVPCLVVNRTFEGIALFPEDLLSPDTTINSRPLTRKRKAETSPVIDQPGVLHMQALLSHPAHLDASP